MGIIMLPKERLQKIIDIIQIEKKVYVSNLSQKFKVTEETIRRDLEKLDKEGVVTRTYGGAVINRYKNEDLPFNTRTSLNIELKKSLVSKIHHLIKDGDKLMVDPSSTTFELVKALYEKQNLTLITNSVKILNEFGDSHHQIISTGGDLRKKSLSLVGPVAQATINRYYADVNIYSCKGISLEKGITESNEPEAELKKYMLKNSRMNILLVDHTKFDKVAFLKLFDISDINVLVTDQKPSNEWIEGLKANNVKLIY
jgi:DeoR/GlpR family transcriptional regulator of sugar metabolism